MSSPDIRGRPCDMVARQYQVRGPEVLPDDLRLSVDDMRAQIIADKAASTI
jgi:hypothetical protein